VRKSERNIVVIIVMAARQWQCTSWI